MEQVLRTVNALNEAGFTGEYYFAAAILYLIFIFVIRSEITMYETLVRPIEVFQIPPLQPINVVSEKLKRSELKREDKRLRQIAANKAAASAKRKRDTVGTDGDDVDGTLDATDDTAQTGGTNSSKRVRMEVAEEDDGVPQMEEEQDMNIDDIPIIGGPSTSAFPVTKAAADITTTPLSADVDIPISSVTIPPAKINVSKALPEVRGHTSYLTFACLVPIPGSVKAPAAPLPDAPTDKTTSD